MMSDERLQGEIIHVNRERGFMFIATATQRDNVFCHCSELDATDWLLCERGMHIEFVIATDRNGRQCARHAELIDEATRNAKTRAPRGYTAAG